MKKLTSFLFYHNAVPLTAIALTLGSASAFAATNPQAIYSEQKQVVSIDNTYIANVNLNKYTPKVRIVSVTEDGDNYYVNYEFTTIQLADDVWQNVVEPSVMTVAKADLGQYRDLGVYVTQQLRQKIERELARLKETQDIEKRSVTQKQVATAYSGLIGGFLDAKTETIPGYKPVVTEVKDKSIEAPPPKPATEEPQPQQEPPSVQEPQPEPEPQPQDTGDTGSSGDTQPVEIAVLGDRPARVPVGGTYTDLGASIIAPSSALSLPITLLLDGVEVEHITIDTSTSSAHIITYRVTQSETSVTEVTRTVIVYAPQTSSSGSGSTSTSTASTTSSSTNTSTSTSATQSSSGSTSTTTSSTSSTGSSQQSSSSTTESSTSNASSTSSASSSTSSQTTDQSVQTTSTDTSGGATQTTNSEQ